MESAICGKGFDDVWACRVPNVLDALAFCFVGADKSFEAESPALSNCYCADRCRTQCMREWDRLY